MLLFSAIMLIYHYHGALTLEQLRHLKIAPQVAYYIWAAVFLSFLSRIPIWPFHYWISSINAGIRNPLAFIITVLMPLTGIYGFLRFLPDSIPQPVEYYLTWINVIGVVTMLFIALIGFINKDSQYKVFSYITVYYIMYLLGVFMHDKLILLNIGFSLFSFILIVATLEVLANHIARKKKPTTFPPPAHYVESADCLLPIPI